MRISENRVLKGISFFFSNFRQHSGSRQLSAPRLLTLEELTKSLKSTLNTLSLILIYLSISLPSYLAAAVQTECWEPGCECRKLECQVWPLTQFIFPLLPPFLQSYGNSRFSPGLTGTQKCRWLTQIIFERQFEGGFTLELSQNPWVFFRKLVMMYEESVNFEYIFEKNANFEFIIKKCKFRAFCQW